MAAAVARVVLSFTERDCDSLADWLASSLAQIQKSHAPAESEGTTNEFQRDSSFVILFK